MVERYLLRLALVRDTNVRALGKLSPFCPQKPCTLSLLQNLQALPLHPSRHRLYSHSPGQLATMAEIEARIRIYDDSDQDQKRLRFYVGKSNMEGLTAANLKSAIAALL